MNNKAIKYTTKTENNNASQKRVFVFLSLCKQNRVRKRTMPQLTTEQRVFIVTHYYETGSVDEVRRRFEEQYPAEDLPSRSTVWRNVHKYKFNNLKQNNRLMVRKAMRDMMRRAALCIDRNGQHVEGKI